MIKVGYTSQPRDICCLDIPQPRDICCLDIPQPRDICCLDIQQHISLSLGI